MLIDDIGSGSGSAGEMSLSDTDTNGEAHLSGNQRRVIAEREENPVLPETVTVLEGPANSKVYLIGTAHFSKESQKDVEEVGTFSCVHVFASNMSLMFLNLVADNSKDAAEHCRNRAVR